MNKLPQSDLIGQRFGLLTVLGPSSELRYLRCKCDCGGERLALTHDLRRGKAKTCGECVYVKSTGTHIRFVVGTQIHKWTVVSEPISGANGRTRLLCRCECGTEREILKQNLCNNESTSCGCDMRRKASERSGTHRMTGTSTYRKWLAMRFRCTNPNDPHYPDYGGRGIKVCERWDSFETFIADMGMPPTTKHELDRFPDNDGPYSPENCRWASRKQQCNNKRDNHRVEWRGETRTVAEWAELLGINYSTLSHRIVAYGWSTERAFTEGVGEYFKK